MVPFGAHLAGEGVRSVWFPSICFGVAAILLQATRSTCAEGIPPDTAVLVDSLGCCVTWELVEPTQHRAPVPEPVVKALVAMPTRPSVIPWITGRAPSHGSKETMF